MRVAPVEQIIKADIAMKEAKAKEAAASRGNEESYADPQESYAEPSFSSFSSVIERKPKLEFTEDMDELVDFVPRKP